MSEWKSLTPNLISTVCSLPENQLILFIDDYLKYRYDKIAYKYSECDGSLLYAVYYPKKTKLNGQDICFVAHTDTISEMENTLIFSLLDKQNENIYHNTDGCFDDRAGILGILALTSSPLACPFILLGQEEIGCRGALQLVKDYPSLKELFPRDMKCLIELDRRGREECVFYDLEYPEFENIFTQYFHKMPGSFTDIAVLAPLYNIAAVNLSAGYYNEHTEKEYFCLVDLIRTLYLVKYRILPILNDKKLWEYQGTINTLNFLIDQGNILEMMSAKNYI